MHYPLRRRENTRSSKVIRPEDNDLGVVAGDVCKPRLRTTARTYQGQRSPDHRCLLVGKVDAGGRGGLGRAVRDQASSLYRVSMAV